MKRLVVPSWAMSFDFRSDLSDLQICRHSHRPEHIMMNSFRHLSRLFFGEENSNFTTPVGGENSQDDFVQDVSSDKQALALFCSAHYPKIKMVDITKLSDIQAQQMVGYIRTNKVSDIKSRFGKSEDLINFAATLQQESQVEVSEIEEQGFTDKMSKYIAYTSFEIDKIMRKMNEYKPVTIVTAMSFVFSTNFTDKLRGVFMILEYFGIAYEPTLPISVYEFFIWAYERIYYWLHPSEEVKPQIGISDVKAFLGLDSDKRFPTPVIALITFCVTILTIMTGSVVTFFGSDNKGFMDSLCKTLMALKNVVIIGAPILALVKMILDYCDIEEDSEKTLRCFSKELCVLDNRITILLSEIDVDNTLLYSFRTEVMKIIKDIDTKNKTYHEFIKIKTTPACRDSMMSLMKKRERLFNIMTEFNASNSVKIVPATVYLYGKSNIGKSNAIQGIVKYLQEIEGKPLSVYERNMTDEYWSGYNQQDIVVFDDFGSSTNPIGATSLISAYNDVPFRVNMADLADKGKFFTSKYLIISSNFLEPRFENINNPDAVYRRRDLLLTVSNPELETFLNANVAKTAKDWKGWKNDYSHLEMFKTVKKTDGTFGYTTDLNGTTESFTLLDVAKELARVKNSNSVKQMESLKVSRQVVKLPVYNEDGSIDYTLIPDTIITPDGVDLEVKPKPVPIQDDLITAENERIANEGFNQHYRLNRNSRQALYEDSRDANFDRRDKSERAQCVMMLRAIHIEALKRGMTIDDANKILEATLLGEDVASEHKDFFQWLIASKMPLHKLAAQEQGGYTKGFLLIGPPGIGKTQLASDSKSHLIDEFFEPCTYERNLSDFLKLETLGVPCVLTTNVDHLRNWNPSNEASARFYRRVEVYTFSFYKGYTYKDIVNMPEGVVYDDIVKIVDIDGVVTMRGDLLQRMVDNTKVEKDFTSLPVMYCEEDLTFAKVSFSCNATEMKGKSVANILTSIKIERGTLKDMYGLKDTVLLLTRTMKNMQVSHPITKSIVTCVNNLNAKLKVPGYIVSFNDCTFCLRTMNDGTLRCYLVSNPEIIKRDDDYYLINNVDHSLESRKLTEYEVEMLKMRANPERPVAPTPTPVKEAVLCVFKIFFQLATVGIASYLVYDSVSKVVKDRLPKESIEQESDGSRNKRNPNKPTVKPEDEKPESKDTYLSMKVKKKAEGSGTMARIMRDRDRKDYDGERLLYRPNLLNPEADTIQAKIDKIHDRVKEATNCEDFQVDQLVKGILDDVTQTQPEACIDGNFRSVKTKVMQNSFPVVGGHALGLVGRIAVVPDHFVVNDHVVIDDELKVPVVRRITNKDLAFFEMPKTTPMFKSLIPHIRSKKTKCPMETLGALVIKEGLSETLITMQAYGIETTKYVNSNIDREVIMYKTYKSMSYASNLTEEGDCGSPFIAMNPQIKTKLWGIHVAGSVLKGYASNLLIEDFQDLLEQVKPQVLPTKIENLTAFHTLDLDVRKWKNVTGLDFEPDVTEYDKDRGFIFIGNFTSHGVKKQPYIGSKTTLRRSPLELQQNEFRPAIMCKGDRGDLDPLEVGISKYLDPRPDIDLSQEECDEIMIDIARYMVLACNDYPVFIKKLTKTEAINRYTANPMSSPIYMNSSAGLPYTMNTEVRTKKPMLKENNGIYKIDVFSDLGKELNYNIDYIDLCLKNKKNPGVIYSVNLKDEVRPIQKIREAKTRLILASPLDYTIVNRQYLHTVGAQIYLTRYEHPIKIGIRPHTSEWHLSELKSRCVSEVGFDGDISEWDKGMSSKWIKSMGKFYIEYLDCLGKLDEETKTVIETMYENKSNPMVMYKGEVLMLDGSQVSGDPKTTDDNSIINFAMSIAIQREIWDEQRVKEPNNPIWSKTDISSLENYVSKWFTGDDFKFYVSKLVSHVFNFKTYKAKVESKFNLKMTPGEKDTLDYELKDVDDLVFLKRKPVKNERNGMYLGALQDEAFEKMLGWCRVQKAVDVRDIKMDVVEYDPETIEQTVTTCLLEASLRGKKFYNKKVQHIKNKLNRYHMPLPMLMNFDCALTLATNLPGLISAEGEDHEYFKRVIGMRPRLVRRYVLTPTGKVRLIEWDFVDESLVFLRKDCDKVHVCNSCARCSLDFSELCYECSTGNKAPQGWYHDKHPTEISLERFILADIEQEKVLSAMQLATKTDEYDAAFELLSLSLEAGSLIMDNYVELSADYSEVGSLFRHINGHGGLLHRFHLNSIIQEMLHDFKNMVYDTGDGYALRFPDLKNQENVNLYLEEIVPVELNEQNILFYLLFGIIMARGKVTYEVKYGKKQLFHMYVKHHKNKWPGADEYMLVAFLLAVEYILKSRCNFRSNYYYSELAEEIDFTDYNLDSEMLEKVLQIMRVAGSGLNSYKFHMWNQFGY